MTTQLDLFAPISPAKSVNDNVMGNDVPQNIVEMPEGQQVVFYWQQFLPAVKKLHEERQTGKNTTGGYSCPDWWKSRFSDFLTNTNTQPKNHEEWVYRRIGYNLFDLIWAKYSDLMIL